MLSVDEFKIRKAVAIKNFRAHVLAMADPSWSIVALDGKLGKPRVFTADEVLWHMQHETKWGKDFILMFSVDVEAEVKRIEHGS
jgi:hypothetical protein